MERRFVRLGWALAVAALLAACGGPAAPPADSPVDRVVLETPDGTVLEVGERTTLRARVEGDPGVSLEVDWSSSDDRIAEVTSDGVVTGVAPGRATITARSEVVRSRSASVEIEVVPDGG